MVPSTAYWYHRTRNRTGSLPPSPAADACRPGGLLERLPLPAERALVNRALAAQLQRAIRPLPLPRPHLGVAPWPKRPGKSPWLLIPPTLSVPERFRVSYLVDPHGHRYLYSSTMTQGTYGKIKLALDVDDTRRDFCVKELRLEPARMRPGKHPTLSRHGRSRTEVSDTVQSGVEVAMSYQFGGPFRLTQDFSLSHRHYLFSATALSNLYEACQALPPRERQVMARYTAAQATQTLRRMHRREILHGDVKLLNMLVSTHAPYVAVSDFGTVRMGTPLSTRTGIMSTYPAPEAFDSAGSLDGRIDMWALGASLLEILNPPRENAQFFFNCVLGPDRAVDMAATRARLDVLLLTLCDLHHPRASRPFVLWLNQCFAVDPWLTTVVVDHLLTDQDDRYTAKQLAELLKGMPPLESGGRVEDRMAQIIAAQSPSARVLTHYNAMLAVRAHYHQVCPQTVRAPALRPA